jgi:hypothetical protein
MQALMTEEAKTSEMLVYFYQTTGRYNPEDSHLRFLICSLTKCYKTARSKALKGMLFREILKCQHYYMMMTKFLKGASGTTSTSLN